MSPSFVFLKKVLFHLKIIVPVSHLCFLLFFLLFFSTQLYQKYLYCILDIFLVYHFNKLTKFYIIGLLFVLFLSNLSFFFFQSVLLLFSRNILFVSFCVLFLSLRKKKKKKEKLKILFAWNSNNTIVIFFFDTTEVLWFRSTNES